MSALAKNINQPASAAPSADNMRASTKNINQHASAAPSADNMRASAKKINQPASAAPIFTQGWRRFIRLETATVLFASAVAIVVGVLSWNLTYSSAQQSINTLASHYRTEHFRSLFTDLNSRLERAETMSRTIEKTVSRGPFNMTLGVIDSGLLRFLHSFLSDNKAIASSISFTTAAGELWGHAWVPSQVTILLF